MNFGWHTKGLRLEPADQTGFEPTVLLAMIGLPVTFEPTVLVAMTGAVTFEPTVFEPMAGLANSFFNSVLPDAGWLKPKSLLRSSLTGLVVDFIRALF
jgi:hypothetical protein